MGDYGDDDLNNGEDNINLKNIIAIKMRTDTPANQPLRDRPFVDLRSNPARSGVNRKGNGTRFF